MIKSNEQHLNSSGEADPFNTVQFAGDFKKVVVFRLDQDECVLQLHTADGEIKNHGLDLSEEKFLKPMRPGA